MDREDWIEVGEIIFIGIFLVAMFLISNGQASSLSYGPNINYSAVVIPNNSYIHQGENISQGNYYDFSGIYGFSGVLAHWSNGYDAGVTSPDYTYTISGSPYSIYIDPAKFPTGQYYQWDGGTNCGVSNSNSASNYFSGGVLVTGEPTNAASSCYGEFGNGNAYVFTVVPATAPITTPTPVSTATPMTVYTNIIINTGNGTTASVPISYTITPTSVPVAGQTIDISNAQTIVIPPTTPTIIASPPSDTSTIALVTQSPLPVWAGILSIVIVGLVLRKKEV